MMTDVSVRNIFRANLWFSIFCLYSISSLPYLLNVNGVYWDDWVMYAQDIDTLNVFFGEIQNGVHGYFIFALSAIGNEVYGFRIVFFIMHFANAYMCYRIFLTFNVLSKRVCLLISVLFLLTPYLHVKAASFAVVPFYFSFFLFIFSFFLLAENVKGLKLLLRVLILLLFFLSFSTGSLLVFYFVVLMFLYVKCGGVESRFNLFLLKGFVSKYFDFLILPVVFFLYKSNFLKPIGLYKGYNSISVESLLMAFQLFFTTLESAFFKPFLMMFMNYGWFGIVVSFLYYRFYLRVNAAVPEYVSQYSKKQIVCFGICSFFVFFLAVFPYLAVHKLPVSVGWHSRFMMLAVIPIVMLSLAVFAYVSLCFKKSASDKVFSCFVVFLLSVSVVKNIHDQHKFNVDWFYSESIVVNFSTNSTVKDSNTFVVHNEVRDYFSYDRNIEFYEWNGMLKRAFGDSSRLMIPPSYLSRLEGISRFKYYKQYNFFEWEGGDVIHLYVKSNKELDFIAMLKLYAYRIFDANKFFSLVHGLVKIEFKNS